MRLFPHVGSGQASTQVEPLKYKGELQLKQFVDVPSQVAQFASQVLHMRLSKVSPYSLFKLHIGPQDLVSFFPQKGFGHSDKQTVELR